MKPCHIYCSILHYRHHPKQTYTSLDAGHKNYLGPITLTGWGLIVQSGILSPGTTKRIPLVGGIIGLCLKIKENIDTYIEQAKTEDQAGLIQICNSPVEIFMEVNRIGKAVQETLAKKRTQNNR